MRFTSTKWPRWFGAELGLEPFCGVPEGRSHHAGIGNHRVERPPVRVKRIGAGPHACERGEIQLHEFKAAAVRRLCPDRACRTLGLGKVTGRTDHVGAMRDQRSRRLHTEPGRYARDQHALSAEIDTRQHVVGGGRRPEAIRHDKLLRFLAMTLPWRQTIVCQPNLM
jgi:hypothetical protein